MQHVYSLLLLIFQFHNLPCVSFRWWSSSPLGEGGALFSIEGASNKVTTNAAKKKKTDIEHGLDPFVVGMALRLSYVKLLNRMYTSYLDSIRQS